MVIYIEYAILDNLIIDAIIIYMVACALHTKFKVLNVTLSLVQGVTYAIITPYITLSLGFLVTIKFAYSLLMVLSLSKYNNIKHFAVTYMLFLSFTFVLGGMCYGILNIFGIPYNNSGLLLNGYSIPISIFVLLATVYVVLLIKLLKHYMKHKQSISCTYDVVITYQGKKYYFRGFLDSGNMLYDGDSPIVVLSFGAFCKMVKNFPFDKLLLDQIDNSQLNNAHYVQIGTLNSNSNMLVFSADKMQICHDDMRVVKDNVTLGVSKKSFASFECLLHKSLF